MIKRLFIKNYKNTSNKDVRNKYGQVAGIYGVISNALLTIIKFIIGLISNSVSIMADAINNMSDMASCVFTIVGFKLSGKKPDHDHPYGYARYEYVFGFVISIFMIIIGLLFIKESIIKIIHPEELVINIYTYIVLGLAIIIKITQMIVYLDFSKSINSNALKASAVDTRNDILSTSAILISMIIMSIYKINIDGYIGLLVSLFVIYSSIKVMKETLDPIIGTIPPKEQVDEIKKKILSYDCVLGIHDLTFHNYGVGNDYVIVHIEVDSNMSIIDAHDLLDEIENDFKIEGINLTIHMDPVIIGDKRLNKLKEKVLNCLKEYDSELSIHDFRIAEGKYQTKVIFDCVVPHEKDYKRKDLVNYLINNIKDDNHKYLFVIEIDRPYV